MKQIFITALATQQLELAATLAGRVAADTVVGGHERALRQTVIGMTAGSELGEQENPGDATVYVLRGGSRGYSNTSRGKVAGRPTKDA